MKYTLITSNGKVMLFYIRGVAEIYNTLYGGVIISTDLSEKNMCSTVEATV